MLVADIGFLTAAVQALEAHIGFLTAAAAAAVAAAAVAAAAAAATTLQTMGREHRDMDVPALIAKLKKSHRWHVETA
jgi:hypothetical protein